MLSHDEIIQIQNEIRTSVEKQVKDGEQSKNLEGALACGQFMNVLHLKQRGIHGTAAAIRVLASFNGNYNNEIGKLIHYVRNRKDFDNDKISLEKDETNVIKIGELLYSLSFVKQGSLDTSSLVKELGDKLISNIKNEKSWGYFIESDNKSEILPTAYAYLGLRSNNFDNLNKIEVFLKSSIEESFKNKKIDNPSLYASIIVAIYVLSNYEIDINQKQLIEKLWKSPFCTMSFNLEQNIEYPYKYEHSYIRIPWQLFFLALSAKYSPRYYSKKLCRQRISDMKLMVKGQGFKYIQSGDELSTRTNSILFDVLEFIDKHSKQNIRYSVFSILNEITWFINRNWLKKTLFSIIIICIGLSIFQWIRSPTASIKDLAPEFIVYLFSVLLIFTKR